MRAGHTSWTCLWSIRWAEAGHLRADPALQKTFRGWLHWVQDQALNPSCCLTSPIRTIRKILLIGTLCWWGLYLWWNVKPRSWSRVVIETPLALFMRVGVFTSVFCCNLPTKKVLWDLQGGKPFYRSWYVRFKMKFSNTYYVATVLLENGPMPEFLSWFLLSSFAMGILPQ